MHMAMFGSAQSSAITNSAPSHDNSGELFSRASVPPAAVSKNNPEWNHVSATTVQGEHIDDYAFLGKTFGVPFQSQPSLTNLAQFGNALLGGLHRPQQIRGRGVILPD